MVFKYSFLESDEKGIWAELEEASYPVALKRTKKRGPEREHEKKVRK